MRQTGAQRVDRLVGDPQLVAVQRPPQVALQLHAPGDQPVHVAVEADVAALALGLGRVHGGVGVAEQVTGVLPAHRHGGDADAGPRVERAPAQAEGLGQRRQDALGGAHRLHLVVDVLEQHGELVAPQPADGVPRSQAAAQALADQDQELVADAVTEAVVDVLEVVEVDEEGGDRRVRASAGDGVLDPVLEEGPVGQVGERVVEGHVGELVLQRPALGVVADVQDVATHVGVLEQVAGRDLDPSAPTVGMADAALEGAGGTRLDLAERPVDDGQVLGVDQGGQPLVLESLGGVPEDPGHRRALVPDVAVDPDHGDHVGGVLHQRPEAGLAAGELVGLHRDRGLEVPPEGDVLQQGEDLAGDDQHHEADTDADQEVGQVTLAHPFGGDGDEADDQRHRGDVDAGPRRQTGAGTRGGAGGHDQDPEAGDGEQHGDRGALVAGLEPEPEQEGVGHRHRAEADGPQGQGATGVGRRPGQHHDAHRGDGDETEDVQGDEAEAVPGGGLVAVVQAAHPGQGQQRGGDDHSVDDGAAPTGGQLGGAGQQEEGDAGREHGNEVEDVADLRHAGGRRADGQCEPGREDERPRRRARGQARPSPPPGGRTHHSPSAQNHSV